MMMEWEAFIPDPPPVPEEAVVEARAYYSTYSMRKGIVAVL